MLSIAGMETTKEKKVDTRAKVATFMVLGLLCCSDNLTWIRKKISIDPGGSELARKRGSTHLLVTGGSESACYLQECSASGLLSITDCRNQDINLSNVRTVSQTHKKYILCCQWGRKLGATPPVTGASNEVYV